MANRKHNFKATLPSCSMPLRSTFHTSFPSPKDFKDKSPCGCPLLDGIKKCSIISTQIKRSRLLFNGGQFKFFPYVCVIKKVTLCQNENYEILRGCFIILYIGSQLFFRVFSQLAFSFLVSYEIFHFCISLLYLSVLKTHCCFLIKYLIVLHKHNRKHFHISLLLKVSM